LKTIVLLLGSLLLAVTVRGTIVFDDFGPGGTYNQTTYFGVDVWGQAAQFTAKESGFLTTIDLALFMGSGTTVNVFLDRNGGPRPSPMGTFLGSGTGSGVISISVIGQVPVTMGSNYWIEVKVAPGSAGGAGWNISSPLVFGLVSLGFPPPTNFTEGVNNYLPAFRVNAEPVPELNVSVLLFVGLIVAFFPLKRTVLRDRREKVGGVPFLIRQPDRPSHLPDRDSDTPKGL
jgi:hypothetical protein